MRRIVPIVLVCAIGLGSSAGADPPEPSAPATSPEAQAAMQKLVGFWTVDVEAMAADPRLKATLDSDQGRAGVAYAQGVLCEFTPDHHLRMHMGRVDDRPATIASEADGTLRIEPQGATPWVVESVTDNSFVQSFPDAGVTILWTRSWQPLVGTWTVAMEALEGEAWFRRLNEQQREALQAEVEALHVDVDDKGAVTGHWEGADRSGTLKLESTVPPGAGVVEGGAGQARAHLVRSDDTGASLYVGDRTWPLEREKAPSKIAVGDWKFDLDRAVEMDWLKRSVPEGKTLEQFIQENVKTDMVIVVTPTTWNNQAYTVLDERANQFAAEANGQVVFWVRVIDDDHLSQFAGGGREFPLTRVGTDGE